MAIGYSSITVTRPTNTAPYNTNDAWADSTTAPTVGGFKFSQDGVSSGKMLDAVIQSTIDPATLLQGEIWCFDAAVTAINDADPFAVSDADMLKFLGVIPFTLATSNAGTGTNSLAHVIDLNFGLKLPFYGLVKVINAYTPASAEVLTVRCKIES